MALGFIIFGWPKRTKEHGPTMPEHCGNCDNQVYFSLFKARRWFSLYFIPVLPLSRAERFLMCSVCGAGYEIDRTEWKRLKSFTSVTKAFEAGEVDEVEYLVELDAVTAELWGQIPEEIADQTTAGELAAESPG